MAAGPIPAYPALYLPPGARLVASDPILVGCVGYWGFGEGGGASTKDLTGQGNDLVQIPAANVLLMGRGVAGSGFANPSNFTYGFRGNTATPTPWQPALGSGNFTAAGWCLRTDTVAGSYAIFGNGQAGAGNTNIGWAVYMSGTNVWNLDVSPDGTNTSVSRASSVNTYTDTVWHHIAVTYQYVGATTSIGIIYIDGRQVIRSTAMKGPVWNTGWPIAVGTRYAGNVNTAGWSFRGLVDEVGYWNRVLTASEIARLYADPLSLYVRDWRQSAGGAGNARLWSLGIPGQVHETIALSAVGTASLSVVPAVAPPLTATAIGVATLAPTLQVTPALGASAAAVAALTVIPASVVLVGPLAASAAGQATLAAAAGQGVALASSAHAAASLSVVAHLRTPPASTTTGVQSMVILSTTTVVVQ
jgi:hypothetical protein